MKKIKYIIAAYLLLTTSAFAQIVVSPYVVLVDQKAKTGTYIVSNKTDETQEVTISFIFGYPVSNEEGNISMKYDTTGSNPFDLTSLVNAFPKKFTLKPGAKQTIRMTVKPTAGMKEGTYWTRIVTSSQGKQTISDTSSTLSASINFILNQVTTVLFRNNRYENTINLNEVTQNTDTNSVNIITSLSVNGDNPFFVGTQIKIYDQSNNVVGESTEFFTAYFDIKKKTSFPITDFKPGNYSAEVTVIPDENSDIPKSDKPMKTPITKKIDFTVQ